MKLFVANWKMNMLRSEALAYARELGAILEEKRPEVELALAPPLTCLDAARDAKGRWALAGQNVAAQEGGPYTGEVSARMLADAGCRYAIVGHSERRRDFGEDRAILAEKLARCRKAGVTPIYCIGETEQERKEGRSEETLARQIRTLAGDPRGEPLVVAYEPVWAIGTGNAATPEDCESACVRIAELLAARSQPRVLYGGSVTPENAAGLISRRGVDGFLIGGASLKADSFCRIAGLLD